MPRFPLVGLTDLCDVLTGGTPNTKRAEYWNGGIPWASVKDFNTGFRWFSATEKEISQAGLDNCSSVLLEPGELILSARGTVGVVAQAGMRTAFNQSNYGLRAKAQVAENDFLYYALLNSKQALLGDAHGGMFDTITRATLDRLLVPCPPLKEQKRIAQFLGLFDKKITVNLDLSNTLEALAEAVFRSWFIDFDPVKAKMVGEAPVGMDAETAALFPDSMEESDLGLIPRGWKTARLGNLVELVNEGAKAGGPTLERPYVPIDQIDSKSILLKNWLSGKEAKTSLVSFQQGDVLFGAMRPYFHKVCIAPFAGTTRSTVFVLRPRDSRWQMFSLMQLFSDSTIEFATSNSSGSTIPYAKWKGVLGEVRAAVPPIPLLARFQELTESLVRAGYGLLAQNHTLSRLRDELLPRLISGELDIPEEMLAE